MLLKETLSSLDFFSSLNDEELELIASFSIATTYDKEYIVHYEKTQSTSLLFLLEGVAKAYKIDKHNNEIFLHYIYAPSLISDVSSYKKETLISFSNVSLIEDSKILNIDYKKFKEHFLAKGHLCQEFANEVILKSQQLQSLINREFIFTSVAKVATMLHDDLDMFNSLKRSEISLILNIQPETLSRVLNRLKRDNIIDSKHTKITILNKEALLGVYEE
ncbi:putative transcriptional regulator, Crp/Fnr family [Sulfurimonas denitrificans DSM 1251]|uniref:Putative transcriptional regulator, Crp/Fnr family n=1 Tax=Sulfurimonas denitrificans (strain ATCC 33889 / DSM 1251) TaxID=326298 RepID=Q30R07_SULDN|nr:Crp/Fnr family transcriptional regulator [Sulfurimonas denitrificans]ABB44574.1 putative transcriptional regulator, Crp/Fnr family [Sulfurimonas denitrificans DSM 1251]MDD3441758.1 Crp/Fnr family transcriptional regulator [Sulfurimonas denitrificans]